MGNENILAPPLAAGVAAVLIHHSDAECSMRKVDGQTANAITTLDTAGAYVSIGSVAPLEKPVVNDGAKRGLI
jgi:hypothetical protein